MTFKAPSSLIALATLVMSASASYAAPDEFGARFTNKAPAALEGEAVDDAALVAQGVEPSAEGLNEIAPAAGEPAGHTAEQPVTDAPAVQSDVKTESVKETE